MLVTNILDEDIINYKKISMFIGTPYCSGKCWRELGLDCSICQNESLRNSKKINIPITDIIDRYDSNPLTEAIVFGGMEPLDSIEDLNAFVLNFRYRHPDPIVIYTGYTEEEAKENELPIYPYKEGFFITIKVDNSIKDKYHQELIFVGHQEVPEQGQLSAYNL